MRENLRLRISKWREHFISLTGDILLSFSNSVLKTIPSAQIFLVCFSAKESSSGRNYKNVKMMVVKTFIILTGMNESLSVLFCDCMQCD